MKYLLSIYCLFCAQILLAQEYPKEWGEVSIEELRMSQYDKDPEAQALILSDQGEAKFMLGNNDFIIWYKRRKRIKLFKKSAVSYAKVEIPLYIAEKGQSETVKELKAFTYNANGEKIEKTPLDPKTIYVETINENWQRKIFTFPNLQDGAILEYEYILKTPFKFNLPDWEFQDRIPTLYSEYKVYMIPYYEYVMRRQGFSEFDSMEVTLSPTTRHVNFSRARFKENIHTFVMKEVPGFKDESYITSIDDYRMKIDVQLSKVKPFYGKGRDVLATWPALTKRLLEMESFGEYLDDCGSYAKKVLRTELKLDGVSEKQKTKAVVEYVKTHFTWNGLYSKEAHKTAKEFYTQKSGNTAELNLFMLALLKHAGINAQAVLLCTRGNGKLDVDYPFTHLLNYVVVICHGERPFLADATASNLAYNRVPPRCFNETGLIVEHGEARWITINQDILSQDRKQIMLNIDPETLLASCTLSIQSTEYDAYTYRNRFKQTSNDFKNSMEKEGFTEVQNIKAVNYDKKSAPYVIHFSAKKELMQIGENLVIAPFLGFVAEENPFTQKERNYPIDFVYAQGESFNVFVGVPEGYAFAQLPESLEIEDDLVKISVKYKLDASLLEINASYSFKHSLYQAEDYAKIKQYMEIIVTRFNDQLLLTKT